ncbi:MAG: DUF3141 domain-containing protein [Pseudomonadota bacterium]
MLAEENLKAVGDQSEMLQTALSHRSEHAADRARDTADIMTRQLSEITGDIQELATPVGIMGAYNAYAKDARERSVLFLDALRKWSDTVIAYNAEGAPPLLDYDSELVKDGRDLPRPCNYYLLKILPPKGVTLEETKRPYVIIDPRAGHGGGIGGFKQDSQVGVALKAGHPVYFVAFRQMPEPGQTLAHVTEAEAAFLRMVHKRHPDSPKPVVIGNCQGGWATAILAATNPDLTGPIILNGAPMSYWGGKVGQDMMRYSGGLAGGALPAMLAGDLAGGIFDGADLVDNFEKLNPGRNYFAKYFDLYQNIDTGFERFIGFEKWWGAFMLMTTEEIAWIVENLFIGNKLSRNQAEIEPGRHIDLKRIRAPIICFASHGDNITPPAQALNWIMDTYTNEREIEVQGQRILYMIHEDVGHLGIFVSGKIANREHNQMAETLANIEAMAPGLYELVIEDVKGHGTEKAFKFSIAKRIFADIVAQTGDRRDEAAFASVARISENLVEAYDSTARPFVKAASSTEIGEAMRQAHPMRRTRTIFNSGLPGMKEVEKHALQIQASREPGDPDNPFRKAEKLWGDMVTRGFDSLRDAREAMIELSFLAIYTSPAMLMFGASRNVERTKKNPNRLIDLPEVQIILEHMDAGGRAEATIRALVLVAGTREDVRGDRLSRSMEVMHSRKPMSDLTIEDRVKIIHEQTVIAHFAPDAALAALPRLLKTEKDRKDMIRDLRYVVGSEDEMADATKAFIAQLEEMLDLPKTASAATEAAE